MQYHFGWAPIAAGSTPGLGFEAFLILSQLATGLGLRGMAEQWRLQKKSVGSGATMGHLIWQLQDNWPGQSFGLLNWGGEWKQQMHFVRRANAPMIVTAAGELPVGGVHIVSDLPVELTSCNVTAAVWEVDGGQGRLPTKQWSALVPRVPRGGVVEALRLPTGAFHDLSPHGWFLRLRATCNGGAYVNENDHFVGNFSMMRRVLASPQCAASQWGVANHSCTFTLKCIEPAVFVVPSAQGLSGVFSDSAFVVLPAEPKYMSFVPAGGQPCRISELKSQLTLDSLHTLLPA